MKKIILGLFLILGAISFAVPKFIDTVKLKNNGFDILQDEEDIFTIGSANKESALIVSYYLTDKNSKELSDAIKADAPADEAKFIAAISNDQAYVNEFQNADFYSYVVVPKNQKLGKYKIYATYATPKKMPKDAVKPAIKFIIDEAEGLVK
jgi:hypothetical protein